MIIGERAIPYLSISKVRYLKFANKNKRHRNLKSAFLTPGSLLRAFTMDMSPTHCNSRCHTSSTDILPPRCSSLSRMCWMSPSSRYGVQVLVSSRIGSVRPESNCACERTILMFWGILFVLLQLTEEERNAFLILRHVHAWELESSKLGRCI
jgi:hypothetical protein